MPVLPAGLLDRLDFELKTAARYSDSPAVRSVAHRLQLAYGSSLAERKFGTWLGGSVLGSLVRPPHSRCPSARPHAARARVGAGWSLLARICDPRALTRPIFAR